MEVDFSLLFELVIRELNQISLGGARPKRLVVTMALNISVE